jgi:hypothetical protein
MGSLQEAGIARIHPLIGRLLAHVFLRAEIRVHRKRVPRRGVILPSSKLNMSPVEVVIANEFLACREGFCL